MPLFVVGRVQAASGAVEGDCGGRHGGLGIADGLLSGLEGGDLVLGRLEGLRHCGLLRVAVPLGAEPFLGLAHRAMELLGVRLSHRGSFHRYRDRQNAAAAFAPNSSAASSSAGSPRANSATWKASWAVVRIVAARSRLARTRMRGGGPA